MGSNMSTKVTYNVDLVFCIDATASMGDLINVVKVNAINLYQDIIQTMAQKQKVINKIRVKVIAFRDYIYDKENAMLTTRFFNLPEEADLLKNLIGQITAMGGGDDPEDGLEALAFAMRSDWDKEGMKKRHVIVVWSDAATHPLGFGREAANYPQQMPKTFGELTAWWGSKQCPGYMNNQAKRLLLFTPDKEGWKTISDTWDNVIHFPSEAGKGLQNVDYKTIIDAIANTI